MHQISRFQKNLVRAKVIIPNLDLSGIVLDRSWDFQKQNDSS